MIFLILFLLLCSFKQPVFASIAEAKIEKTTISLSPELNFFLPNAAIDIYINQEISNTNLDFTSKYDFLDNYIDAKLNFFIRTNLISPGLTLQDKVDFETMFFSKSSLQRDQYITPYLILPVLKNTNFKPSIRFDNTYTISTDTFVYLDKGKDVAAIFGIEYNSIEEQKSPTKGLKVNIDLISSTKFLGSNYSYTNFESKLLAFIYFSTKNYLKLNSILNFPISDEKKPLSFIYYFGGYEVGQGYNFKELQGDSLLYNKIVYSVPLLEKLSTEKLQNYLKIITIELFLETCKIGTKEIFDKVDDWKTSFGIGFSCELTILKMINTRFNFSIAKAFEVRNPIFYFNFSTFNII